MILILAATITLLGFIGWVVGSIFEMPAIAIIGAMLIVGTGAMMMTEGLQVRDGHVETNVSQDETRIDPQYRDFEPMNTWPLAELWLLLGGVMTLRSVDSISTQ